jgi:O-antigen/teichoic acid export membrane protein
LIAFFCAPIGLAVFGRAYVSGALVPLRWLIVAGFITMLNYASGAILFIAKKSAMMTIVNLINAIVVLGLVAFWATNVADVAIAWMIGDICNTVFFGLFAFLALRQVGGRWEELGGGRRMEPAARVYRPRHKRPTEPQSVLSVAVDAEPDVDSPV